MSENSPRWPLTQLNLYLTGYHSIECRCCQGYSRAKTNGNGNGHKPFLPLETIARAVSEALPLGLREVRLCGEQPFLYPQWSALLERLAKWELGLTIETNGTGLTDEQVACLAGLHLPSVRVVVGWAEPGPGSETSFAAADAIRAVGLRAEGIHRLAKAGLAPQVVFPVTRHTSRQIPAVIRVAEQSGAKSVRFSCIPPFPQLAPGLFSSGHDPARPRGEALTVEEVIALGCKIERQLSRTTPVRLYIDQPPAFRGLHPQAPVEGQGFCALLNNVSILPGGVVALCSAIEVLPQLAFGKIGETSLEAIWNTHPVLVELRAGMPDQLEGICGRCVMKTACLGYCVAENLLRSGSYYGPNWFCQTAEQVGLFPAGRIIENAW